MGRTLLPHVVTLALALAGCSGTPFGEQLSGSFPEGQGEGESPVAPAPAPAPDAGSPPDPAPAPAPVAPQAQEPAPTTAPDGSATPAPVTPVPYRLTLRLTGADPSAPAEAVTRALRAAGLAFEVEVIERIPDGAAPAAPAGTPAPAAPGTSASR